MNWLLHNVIADLDGPTFLAFYLLAIVAVIVASRVSINLADPTRSLDPLEIPTKLDPYEIAFLRGGPNEVTRVAIASLIQRGILKIIPPETRYGSRQIDRETDLDDEGPLTHIEEVVADWSEYPATAAEIFDPKQGLAALVSQECLIYEKRLGGEELLLPAEVRDIAWRLWWLGSGLIVAIGGYKLAVALAKGHTNVQILIGMGTVGPLLLLWACRALPRLSHRGRAYLHRLQFAFGTLKTATQRVAIGKDASQNNASIDQLSLTQAAAWSDASLVLGIYGLSAMSGVGSTDIQALFAHSSQNHIGFSSCGSGCGAGCGSGCGGGGCGGGCGGCGG
jgi:uncharacterized protein (TIGR04222 family)